MYYKKNAPKLMKKGQKHRIFSLFIMRTKRLSKTKSMNLKAWSGKNIIKLKNLNIWCAWTIKTMSKNKTNLISGTVRLTTWGETLSTNRHSAIIWLKAIPSSKEKLTHSKNALKWRIKINNFSKGKSRAWLKITIDYLKCTRWWSK